MPLCLTNGPDFRFNALRQNFEGDHDEPERKSSPGRRLFLGHAGPGAQAAWRVAHPCGLQRRRCAQRFRDLLEFFFQIHDPSTPGRQGNDRGSSYRSAIFYTSDEQLATAQQTIADVNASGLWPGKVVTELAPAGPFWEAEPEHQDYLVKHPNGYTCHYPRAGWKLPRREIG